MPIYVYACDDCFGEWKESHGMTEEVDNCHWCESGNIYRKPSAFVNLSKQFKQKLKVGSHVKEFIEDSRKELEQQKKEAEQKND
tara:strand:+ start:26043 stop:26294 length:252 start_codon:yes stop_codon:yes gene_type:complete